MSGAPNRVLARDVTPSVDTQGLGGGGAWDVKRREAAFLVKQEPMSGASSRVLAHDVTLRVDPEGPCGGGARDINDGKSALVKQEAMIDAPAEYWPTMSPRGLIPKGWVDEAPGTSIVVKLPSTNRKP